MYVCVWRIQKRKGEEEKMYIYFGWGWRVGPWGRVESFLDGGGRGPKKKKMGGDRREKGWGRVNYF